MKKLKKLLGGVENQIDRFILQIENNYDHSVSDLPSLFRIKNAHQNLLSVYVKNIIVANNLDFFVFIRPGNKVKSGTLFRKVLAFILHRSLFRLLTLRPLVSLFVETHIYQNLNKLEMMYSQLKYIIPSNHPEKREYLLWICQAKNECKEVRETISSINNYKNWLRSFGVYFIGVVFTIFGVSTFNELINKFANKGVSQEVIQTIIELFVLLLVLYVYGYIFIDSAFDTKRKIFLKSNLTKDDDKSCYKLENKLYNLIGRRKKKEFAIDIFSSILEKLLRVFIFSFFSYQLNQLYTFQEQPILVLFGWGIVTLLVIDLFKAQIIPWRKRFVENEI
jgi:hypothetical protein